ncbi:ABC transporter permease/substrate binding protein [Weissella cibaria]|uniref:OpuAB protein n=1 Tax=Weissella cibaria TaxID=137591 RepID=A0A0D1LXJ3_9LACO|nr:ABC transporter permease/substrate binding protein [Weissella cibaria]KIU19846.1 Glycine betaine transport system permease protein OpuAB [Weissella cibaria]KIU23222.1 Glycine betaine transport system permease protein OpuAB [Weissella cibaria]MDV8929097.1 ABC transporter permease/substrate binding protein [Weissella cibaria]
MTLLIGKIPVAGWVESAVNWLTSNLSGFFDAIQTGGNHLMNGMTNGLIAMPSWAVIIGVTIFAILSSGKKWGFVAFTFLGLLFIANQNLWSDLMNTLTLVVVSSLVSIVIGVPLGIWMAKKETVAKIVQPVLDFMQTMPGFVYLIPAVAFFGIGVVPGVFASVIFALPPTVRMSNLGIRQVPKDLVEAADSYGSTPKQKLFKLELPLATGTILAGINQTIMLALSMVVIASMIGAPGLGRGVLSAVQNADIGKGFVNGLALVILAIIIDRFTQKLNVDPAAKQQASKGRWKMWTALAVAVAMVGTGVINAVTSTKSAKESVNLVYVQWDSEVASSNVLAEAMREHGYNVKLTPLDNSIMWQSVANGQADASVSAWLPNTHAAQYKKYKDQIDLLGPNLTGASTGFVVPSYMNVQSISDLTTQAGKTVTGIEPGAGVMKSADKALADYGLKEQGWTVTPSSSGAMAVALGKAIKEHKDIVITGWQPHWMFQKYDLKYLKDPKQSFGKAESLNTFTRKGLKADKPDVYKVLKNFHWTKEDMGEVMLATSNGKSAKEAAKDWIKAHPKQVDAWFK